jgi:7-keto-8-aminopelargonate synthetase-like enzyme
MAYSDKIRQTLGAELEKIQDAGTYKVERVIHSAQDSNVQVEFPPGDPARPVINMCANNYLGLSNHPEVVQAAHEGLDSHGFGMSSVRFICGTQDIHLELENKLTEFLGTESTILFGSCLDANAGVFEAICTDEDVLIADRLVHASIIDGIRLAPAQRDTYKHGNMKHLEQKLEMHQDKRMRIIVTDGVFSMDGDLAPMDQICDLADQYDALVFVDDCHGTGYLGETGRGVRARALRRRRPHRHPDHDAGQGDGRGDRWLCERAQGDRRSLPAEGPTLSVQQRGGAFDHHGEHEGARDLQSFDRAPGQAHAQRRVVAQRTREGRLRPEAR